MDVRSQARNKLLLGTKTLVFFSNRIQQADGVRCRFRGSGRGARARGLREVWTRQWRLELQIAFDRWVRMLDDARRPRGALYTYTST